MSPSAAISPLILIKLFDGTVADQKEGGERETDSILVTVVVGRMSCRLA